MKLAMVGLGKMGANMVRRLVLGGHQVVAFNRSPEVTKELAQEINIITAFSLEEVVSKLEKPRVVWVMVPAGDATESMLGKLRDLLEPGDLLIDGGNSNFNDTIRRAPWIEEKGLHYVDVGTSGGIWGLKEGYSMMIGGDEAVVESIRPILATLAPDANEGWGRVGPHGAGHYVKMVHNGIEYGLMEAYAEGFEILRSRKDFQLNLYQISQIWRTGSVVRSWLLDLTGDALKGDQELSNIQGWVADSGEGRWTVFEAINNDVPAPIITLSLLRRFESRQDDSYAAKLLAAMRNEFGGHAVKKSE